MGHLLFCRDLIQRIAYTDGVMPEIRDRLLVISSRSRDGCSQDDAARAAYLLYRMLLPDLVH